MNRRNFLKAIGFGAVSLAIPGCVEDLKQSQDDETNKPNFVFILMDDLGWADINCNGSATHGRFYQTPNIDKLASEGMRFTDAYAACPVCSPTRASILSGKYPARLRMTDWIGADRRIVPYITQLPLEEVTIAEALKEADYSNAFVGKWHLGGEKYWPPQQGFDINKGGCGRGQPPSYFSPYKIETLTDGPEGEYLTDRLTNEAVDFINKNRNRPFLLYLAHYAVHTPLQAKKEMIEKYKAIPRPENKYQDIGYDTKSKLVQDNPTYATMIQSMDESIGKIMETLKETGIEDFTVVVFMSDNGGLATFPWKRGDPPTSNAPLKAGKGWLYEGGVREPMIIKWPGVTKPGSICDVPVTSTDFYPTMLEIAGLPLKPKQHCDGVSIVSLLKGKNTLQRKAIYWHYPHYHGGGGKPSGSVRAGDYKLIEFFDDNHVELYNLKNDLSENNEISVQNPQKTEELRNMLHEWRKEVNAITPTPESLKKYLEMIKKEQEDKNKK